MKQDLRHDFARQAGVTEEDLALYWQAMRNMWDTDRSAARGTLALRGCYIYTHQNPLGNAPAHHLLERVTVKPVQEGQVARSIKDYVVTVDEGDMPKGIMLTKLEELSVAGTRGM